MSVKNIEETAADYSAILGLVPHGAGFRFIDKIISLSEQSIVGQYTFNPDLPFYAAHFPGQPVTPGVILIETMAQTAVVALGIHLMRQAYIENGEEDPKDYLTMFSDCQVEFFKPVYPGATVTIHGERIYWRRKKLRVKAELCLADGSKAAEATLSGMGVKRL